MLEVKFSKEKGMIAILQHRDNAVVGSFTFPYLDVRKVMRRNVKCKGVILGNVLESLSASEVSRFNDKLLQAYNAIQQHLQSKITLEPYYSSEEKQWIIKGYNPCGQYFFLSAIQCNSYVTDLKRQRTLRFKDGSFISLSSDGIEQLHQQIESVKRVVFSMNQSMAPEKFWLRDTVVIGGTDFRGAAIS